MAAAYELIIPGMSSKLVTPKQLSTVLNPIATCPTVFEAQISGSTVFMIAGAATRPHSAMRAPPPVAMNATLQIRNEARMEDRGTD
mmetsp:Transcript_13795/g.28161  ORF Transcript_13795/g.28161 Transcript_13795/m.28161 type:complete len:86 (-) Transcript_13795:671-928(-)